MALMLEPRENLIKDAEIKAKANNYSIDEQFVHWIKIGQIAEDNPDLTYAFIKNILIAQQEAADSEIEVYTYDI